MPVFKAWNDRPFPNGSSDFIEHHYESPPAKLPIPEELSAIVTEWETSGANHLGYEQLIDEAIAQHVRGVESP